MNNTILTVDLVLFSRERCVALIDGKYGWALPGGKINEGETKKEALLRETHEELGFLLPETTPLLYVGKFDAPERDHRGNYVSYVYTYVVEKQCFLFAGSDAKDARWFSLYRSLPELAFDHDQMIEAARRIVHL